MRGSGVNKKTFGNSKGRCFVDMAVFGDAMLFVMHLSDLRMYERLRASCEKQETRFEPNFELATENEINGILV